MVTTLNINFKWRRIISDALQSYADNIIAHLPDADIDDFRNKFQALLDDFYTPDSMTKAFSVDRTTSTGFLTAASLQTIPVSEAKDTDGLITINGSGQIVIAEAGWYTVDVVMSVLNNVTAASVKLIILKNITQNLEVLFGNPEVFQVSQLIRSWACLNGVFQCDAGDTMAIMIYATASSSQIIQDAAVGSHTPRCLNAYFTQVRQ